MPSVYDILSDAGDKHEKLINLLTKDTIENRTPQEYLDEYKGKRERRKKSIDNKEDKYIGEGQNKKIIHLAKLKFDFPQKIVRTVTAFCVGGEMIINYSKDPNEAFELFKEKWITKLKMKGLIKQFVRTVLIETKAAILFYPVVNPKDKSTDIRAILLNQSNGDFYPHFDQYGDMDAFTRKYETINTEGKKITIVDIYTAHEIIIFTKLEGQTNWTTEKKPNLFKKLPVVYSEQDEPEWQNVTALMDEFELRVSRLADTNDYFSEPILKLFGTPKHVPGKETVGKMVEFELQSSNAIDGKPFHGDASYLTWDQTPESVKLELETLLDGIYSMSSTPNTSFDNMKGLGAISGVALKLMFLDAILNASDKMEIFGPAIQRMVSVVKAGIGGFIEKKYNSDLEDTDIEVTFKNPLPDDVKDWLEMLGKAKADRIISTETAIKNNMLIKNPKKEITLIKEDEAMKIRQEKDFGGSLVI